MPARAAIPAGYVLSGEPQLLAGGERTAYLLKSRVADVAEFVETLGRVAKGGLVVDSRSCTSSSGLAAGAIRSVS